MMPVVALALQYGLLLLLYLFLLQVTSVLRSDLREASVSDEQARERRLKQPELVVLRGTNLQKGERFRIAAEGGTVSLGRASDNQIVIADPYASAHHARILWSGERCCIEDQQSSNGTFVNGKRVEKSTSLKAGDRIEIGNTLLRIEFATE